jgi:hypothetical protein
MGGGGVGSGFGTAVYGVLLLKLSLPVSRPSIYRSQT